MAKVARDFQIFAKPAGALCNLECSYCYYKDKSGLYPDAAGLRMPEEVLEKYIIQHLEAASGPEVYFSWHGGEPTTRGLDFFRKVVELQRKYRPAGWRVRNGIQTNGILLDEEWAQFLAAEEFGIGLSLDGPAELHNSYRVTRGGEPSHKTVMRAYDLLHKFQVQTDILCVVHNINVHHPLTVYRFFREIGVKFIGFLPAVEESSGSANKVSPYTPGSEEFGIFLCRIFDEWISRDVGRIMIQYFDEAARPALGLEHSLCIFREACGQIPVLEHNGDLFPCDHFVVHEHRLGNILDSSLIHLLDSAALKQFGHSKKDALPRFCLECEVLDLCNGGCPKYRFIQTPDGEPGLNYLCAGLKRFFLHSRAPIEALIARQRRPAPRPKPIIAAQAGRNDPCPCGSGKKFKKCCGARQ